MPGSITPLARTWPAPLELLVRAMLATVLVLCVVRGCGYLAVRPLAAVLPMAVEALDARFDIHETRVMRARGSQVVRLRANLARPVMIDGRLIYPFGSYGQAPGGIQVIETQGGVLAYGALMLIVILAWPGRGREIAARLAMIVPAATALTFLAACTTTIAELQHALCDFYALQEPMGWMVCSRFLMGGGGFVLALTIAVSVIAIAHRWRMGGSRSR